MDYLWYESFCCPNSIDIFFGWDFDFQMCEQIETFWSKTGKGAGMPKMLPKERFFTEAGWGGVGVEQGSGTETSTRDVLELLKFCQSFDIQTFTG